MDPAIDQAPPRLDEPVPDGEAVTTRGRTRLAALTPAGAWVVAFTLPVEAAPDDLAALVDLARHAPEVEAGGVRLLALATEAPRARPAWLNDLERSLGGALPFPVVTDLEPAIAAALGLPHPAFAVAVIDPTRVLRAVVPFSLAFCHTSATLAAETV